MPGGSTRAPERRLSPKSDGACADMTFWMLSASQLGTTSRAWLSYPKCQGAAAKGWLAARVADLLPVGYFHLVFTLPAEVAPIAYQNKSVVYDLLFRAAGETPLAGASGWSW